MPASKILDLDLGLDLDQNKRTNELRLMGVERFG
jgi:hypothetical protein